MKSQRTFVTLTIGALVCAGFSTASAQSARPVIITPPAVKDGSNWSRAPFPAQRQFDDVKPADGQAIDQTVPPNTPATNIEPPVPASTVAVMAPAPAAVVTTTTTTAEPVLTPTGRPTVGVVTTTTPTTTYYAPEVYQSARPVVITPPAIKDGSNWSRAPFPAKRQFDDVKSPDGQAIDLTVPPNTPATNIEPAIR